MVMEAHVASVTKAIGAGVKVAMGTDSGVTPHGQNLRELPLMVECGMSPAEALVATTRTAAELLGIADGTGTLEPGKVADVVVLDGDALDLHDLAGRVRRAYQGGTLVSEGRQPEGRRARARRGLLLRPPPGRPGRALADDEFGGELDARALAALALGEPEYRAGGEPSISVRGWRTVVSGGDDQRTSGRSSKPTTLTSSGTPAAPAHGFVDAERHLVARGEARSAGRRGRAARHHRRSPTRGRSRPPGQPPVDADPGGLQRLDTRRGGPAAEQPGRTSMNPICRWPRASRCCVARMPPAQFVAPIVGTVEVGGAHRVDHHHRHSQLAQLGVHGLGEVGEDEDHPVGRPLPHVLQPLPRRGRPAVDRRDHRADAGGVPDVLDAAEDLDRPRAVEVVEDQVDQAGCGPTPTGGLAPVAVLAEEALRPAVGFAVRRPSAR